MVDERRIHLLAATSAGAALATMAARVLPFVGTGWSKPADLFAFSVLADPEVLVLLAFSAVVVALARPRRTPLLRWTRGAVVVAVAVQVPSVLWTAWRVATTAGSPDAPFEVSSPAAQASIYLLLGSVLLVAVSAGLLSVRRPRAAAGGAPT